MRLAASLFVAFLCSGASAQDVPDCTIGHLEIGAPAPKYNRAEYSRSVTAISVWFYIGNAQHWRSKVQSGTVPYEQFLEIKDNKLVAIVREFTVPHSPEVLDALEARYGPAQQAVDPWISFFGDCSEEKHVVWFDAQCGIRIDAFPSIDPADPDERMAVVWTKGAAPPPRKPATDAIR